MFRLNGGIVGILGAERTGRASRPRIHRRSHLSDTTDHARPNGEVFPGFSPSDQFANQGEKRSHGVFAASPNRDLACTFLLASLGLALGDLGVAQQGAVEPRQKPLAAETRLLTHDFSIDSRSQYEITGRVDWGKGKLAAYPGYGAEEDRAADALDLTLDIELPAPSGSEKAAQFQVDLRLSTPVNWPGWCLTAWSGRKGLAPTSEFSDHRPPPATPKAGPSRTPTSCETAPVRLASRFCVIGPCRSATASEWSGPGASRAPGVRLPGRLSGAEPARATALRFTSVAGELALRQHSDYRPRKTAAVAEYRAAPAAEEGRNFEFPD